jgi:phosphoserine phosphatase
MTLTKGMLLSASRSHTSLAGLAVTLNHHLYLTGRRRTFVTMVLGALEPETGRLELVRAGHGPVLHYRAADGGVEWLNPAGIGLGLAGDSPFRRALETRTIRLSPGDVAVFYSDGLNEAMNRDQELFGEERLREVVQQHAAAPAVAIRDAILAGVERFTGGAEANDDLTMVVLRVDPPAVH